MEGVLDGPGSGPGKGKKGCSGNEFVQPGEKDTQVQLVISMALGLTAFMAFCVSKTAAQKFLECMHADPSDLSLAGIAPTMEKPICRETATARALVHQITCSARHLLWVDPRPVQDHRRSSAGSCWA